MLQLLLEILIWLLFMLSAIAVCSWAIDQLPSRRPRLKWMLRGMVLLLVLVATLYHFAPPDYSERLFSGSDHQ